MAFKFSISFYVLVSLFGLLSFAFAIELETDLGYKYVYCNGTRYEPNSTFEANLNILLYSLTSNATQEKGFYMFMSGPGTPFAVSGQFLCRGDISPTTCQNCVKVAAKEIIRSCPYQTESLIYYDLCILSYTNRFFKANSTIATIVQDEMNLNGTEQSHFNQLLRQLLSELAVKAVNTLTLKMFASDEAQFTSTQKLHGLVQCRGDLTSEQCSTCLENAIQHLSSCCEKRKGSKVLLARCNVRYELLPFDFVNATSGADPQVPLAPSPGKGDNKSRTIVVIVVPIAISMMLFCLGCFFLRRKTKMSYKAILREIFGEESSSLKSLQFNLATIEAATNKFSYDNRIGKGGFGEVYKGILPDGREVAVKRLSKDSGQGALEFKNEVLLIARLQHRNLVALIGFCLEEQEKILIYEFVHNKSIDRFLFDYDKPRVLDWSERLKILKGIGRGLLYLHDHSRLKVIHRDLKPSNILLDRSMNPKISDFGMARMVPIDQDQGNTTRVVGTYGYMAPEYIVYGQFSEKSDVFSFGVIALEVISGKRNARSYESHLLSHAWKQWHSEMPLEVLDPNLRESCSQIEVIRCVQIGLLCVQENPDDRPPMAEIISYLSNLSIEMPSPKEPAFFLHGRHNRNMFGQSSQMLKSSLNEMSKSEFLPR